MFLSVTYPRGCEAVSYGGLFFLVANRYFFAFRLVFAPSNEEIEPALLVMSMPTLGEVPRSVPRFSRVTVTRIPGY